ncbi:hypothetical protein B2J93_2609 [Marssonina coronariae]|uniref:T6SS Phospholipase effector Tle1-like catalytic domain-containing protein n=1 Tax=Diplocarpon coronariae TaxID=2795749 RepID=A0A218YWK1_9HELO|nr:hypothetical protein B2J93_2609 [Marssonina coronariae]
MGDRTLEQPESSLTKAQDDFRETFKRATSAPRYPNKRLVVCCDGTWNAGDDGQPLTNVAKIARCVADVDVWGSRNIVQIVHYLPGVGTGTRKNANIRDGMFGKGDLLAPFHLFGHARLTSGLIGIGKTIRAAYAFICMNWSNKHDEIVLVGFSRGAFAARCVAQLIQDVGLLTKSGLRHLRELFVLWKHLGPGEDRTRLDQMREKLQNYRELVLDVKIHACAVWDTVSAVGAAGLPVSKHLPRGWVPTQRYRMVGKTIPANVQLAVQALALGEQRKLFIPLEWNPPDPKKQPGQVLVQRWFAGNHSDVGGGNEDMTHVNITLAWMVAQLMDTIQFNQGNLWAITTTRSWSKPSPSDDPEAESSADARLCKVVARSPISSGLLRSETSWLAWLMWLFSHGPRIPVTSEPSRLQLEWRRLFGIHKKLPSDANQTVEYHHSVYILRHLGIANYAQLAPAAESEGEKSKNDVLRISEEAQRGSFGKVRFEAELLEKWAKHILCAHVNLRQARDWEETIGAEDSRYPERVRGILVENASYEAEIPICAILSAFHKLAERDDEDGKDGMLHNIYADLDAQSQKPQSWAQVWKEKRPFGPRSPAATFNFESLGPVTATDSLSGFDEYELRTEHIGNQRPALVFTRTYPLLMGRCHEMDRSEMTPAQKISSRVPWHPADGNYKLPPCEKCARIWMAES